MTPSQAVARVAETTGIRLVGLRCPGEEQVIGPEALAFVEDLVRRFAPRVRDLLAQRRAAQARYDAGERPRFLDRTRRIREAAWTVAPLPSDLLDRRVEITGPVDRKTIINALNSGANVFMADFEDATAPSWDNLVQGQVNLVDAVLGTIVFDDPATGKSYRPGERTAVLMARPRGWHLSEKNVEVDGLPVPAALFDFGIFLFANAKALLAKGTGPYFYLPKLQSHHEARLWNDVFDRSERALALPAGTIRATVLIETLPAAFEMDEILWELRDHAAGLNCGRWDYIFSFIKVHRNDPSAVLPDRAQVTMSQGFLNAYARLLVATCHRRGAAAIGGMAAQIPIKNDSAANDAAIEKVRADKRREVAAGHDGTWVAHPGLVPVAREIFDGGMPAADRIHATAGTAVEEHELLRVPEGTRTEAGLRLNLRVAVQYLESWLRGVGCVPLDHLMEDAATAEISRAQVWQWIRHGASLADGRTVTPALVRELLASETAALCAGLGVPRFERGRFADAIAIVERLVFSESFDEFLTVPAYDLLLDRRDAARA
jgi:malate synthase